MRQYLRELQSQQTRFNLNVLIRVAELEDRVARLEERAGDAPARPSRALNVHQILSGAGPYDAVTTQALAFRDLFGGVGLGRARRRRGDRPAHRRPDRAAAHARRARRRRAARALLGVRAEAARGARAAAAQAAHLAQHHARALVLGPRPAGRRSSARSGASSCRSSPPRPTSPPASRSTTRASSARTRSSRSSSTRPGSDAARPRRQSDPAGPPTILFVGRLAPHKRQDAVIRAFELYRRRHAPDARLVLVGAPINWAYDAAMRELAEATVARPRDDRVGPDARAARRRAGARRTRSCACPSTRASASRCWRRSTSACP